MVHLAVRAPLFMMTKPLLKWVWHKVMVEHVRAEVAEVARPGIPSQ